MKISDEQKQIVVERMRSGLPARQAAAGICSHEAALQWAKAAGVPIRPRGCQKFEKARQTKNRPGILTQGRQGRPPGKSRLAKFRPQMVALRQVGATYKDIAKAFGVTAMTARYHVLHALLAP